MEDGFHLSFKNIEVRMAFYILLPLLFLDIILLLRTGSNSRTWLRFLFSPTIGWVIYFSWLFFHRKKKRKQASE